MLWANITDMLNARTAEFATATQQSASAFRATKERAAKEQVAQMTAQVMEDANISSSCLTVLYLQITSQIKATGPSLPRTHTLLTIFLGINRKPEVAFAILSMGTLIAQRECANTELMLWIRELIWLALVSTKCNRSNLLLTTIPM